MIIYFPPFKQRDIDRFMSKVMVRSLDECWEWKTCKNNGGYGQFYYRVSKKSRVDLGAHRFSYLLFKGRIPKGLCVCHSCDNRSCVNPKHLWLGTRSDNMTDMVKKGRKPLIDGERNKMSKLTEEQILYIRSSLKKPRALARELGVAFQTISKIRRNIRWRHLS